MTTEPELEFTFERRTVTARSGQSIAGALHAAGVRTLSRGVKYHRPRGFTCGFGACGGCPLQVDGLPATVSCTTPVRGGEHVRREGGLPTVSFDVLRAADLMRPLLKAGFQFSLFARQPRLSKLAGTVLAVLAGGGRAPSSAAAVRSHVARVEQLSPDVLVIGGGVSGLSAALAAADAGAQVALVDPALRGGRSRVRTEPVLTAHGPVHPGVLSDGLLSRITAHERIRVVQGVALGITEGLVPVVDEATRTRTEVRPAAVILATGTTETPVLIPGHDLPGVMLADGALRLALLERVRPGRRAVVIANDDRAAAVAATLQQHGVPVVATIPAAHVRRVTGWGRATGVLTHAGAPGPRRYRADLVCVVGPRRPANELELHAAYSDAGSHELVSSDAEVAGLTRERSRFAVVGSAAGIATYDVDRIGRIASELVRAVQLDRAVHHDHDHAPGHEPHGAAQSDLASVATSPSAAQHTPSPHSGVNKGETP